MCGGKRRKERSRTATCTARTEEQQLLQGVEKEFNKRTADFAKVRVERRRASESETDKGVETGEIMTGSGGAG